MNKFIFSIRYYANPEQPGGIRVLTRRAAVGPQCIATVEAALRGAPERIQREARQFPSVREFAEGRLGADESRYHTGNEVTVTIGYVHEVVS